MSYAVQVAPAALRQLRKLPTMVLEGEFDHRDTILSEKERAKNETMFICVSRSKCPKLALDA